MNDRPENMDARLQTLVKLIIEGSATEQNGAELELLLQSSAEARRYYCRSLEVHAHLNWLFRAGASAGALPLDPTIDPIAASLSQPSSDGGLLPVTPAKLVASGSWSVRSVGRWASAHHRVLAYAAMLLVMISGGVVYQRLQRETQTRVQSIGKGPAIMVATLQSDADCVWAESKNTVSKGSQLKSGSKLQLISGTAQMRFGSGAAVVIDSPADFELLTANSMRLNSGTIAARVNGPVKDFVVELRNSSIIDRGTSFGVHCNGDEPAQVEVFEGAVEVFPSGDEKRGGRLLEFGTSAQIDKKEGGVEVEKTSSRVDRYDRLLEYLWSDMQVEDSESSAAPGDMGTSVQAEFNDAATSGGVDAFYGAVRGRGWVTPWLAVGNPTGRVATLNPLSGAENPYLMLTFHRSSIRTIARAYGRRPGFDPREPHLISWTWRFDGTDPIFGRYFEDKVAFYGNPSFRRGSYETNSWLISMNGSNEAREKKRKVHADYWCFFNGNGTEGGKVFDRANMVNTEMRFKPSVLYHFAVAVFPERGEYDAAIRDDEKTVAHKGLKFRNQSSARANAIHFGIGAKNEESEASFSLDSVRIEPLTEGGFEQRVKEWE